MASKFAIMGFMNRRSNAEKAILDQIFDLLIQIESDSKNNIRVDDICDKAESLISELLNNYRK